MADGTADPKPDGERGRTGHDVRQYYEVEAARRIRRDLTGRRVELRDAFVATVIGEGRTSVIDCGAGPGWDGVGFRAAGLSCIGIDLAVGNGHLAVELGVHVVPGSVLALPVRPGSFDAGWSMSTLMHLSDADMATAASELVATLTAGSPVCIGLWGSEPDSTTTGLRIDHSIAGQARPFFRRTAEHNGEVLAGAATIESTARWPIGGEGSEYQVFRLRT